MRLSFRRCYTFTDDFIQLVLQWLKWFCEAGGSPDEVRLEKNPIPHSNPTNLASFRHKIALYRFNQGAHTIAGGAQMGAGGGLSPLTLTTVALRV